MGESASWGLHQLPAQEGNPSLPSSAAVLFVWHNWPSLSSYSQGGVLAGEGMSGAKHTPTVTSAPCPTGIYQECLLR